MTAAVDDSLLMEHSTAYRLQKLAVSIDGGQALDFKRYPYIPKIIDSRPPKMTIIKGGQMGFSIACILKALEEARTEKIRGVLYLFPSDGEVQDFSKARFAPLMANNQHVWGPDVVGNTDAAGLKEIGNSFIYFRGAGQKGGAKQKSMSKLKSMPIDRLYGDERDEMADDRWDAAIKRLDGSLCRAETILSTPTIPGYGVDLEYQSSNQSSFLWKCFKCNEWTCLEDHYPECIAEPTNGDPFYLCMKGKCRESLTRDHGDWVARKPDIIDHEGYWASQLCSPTRTPREIVLEENNQREKGRMREFYNQTLARPYAEVEDQITEQQLSELVTEDLRPLSHEGPAAMGVDPGKPNWYTVRVRITEKDSVQIARGRADTYEELAKVAKRFNVTSGVMDMGYDPSAVMRFVDEHPGWYGCLYVGAKKTDADWNHTDKQVKVGRTRLLDDAHNDILSKRVSYHAKDEFWHGQFVPQMTNLKRTSVENPTTGDRTAQWVVTGGQKNDHLRHADAYAHLAQQRVGLSASVQRVLTQAKRRGRTSKPRSAMVM